jgi:uncharacterized repeat protein (TIGR02543 family)
MMFQKKDGFLEREYSILKIINFDKENIIMKKNLLWGSTILLLLFYLFLSPFSSLAALPGDFNSDGKVDFEDFMLFALAYGSTSVSSNWNAACDLDPDGKIDFEDLMLFAVNYGKEEEPDTTVTIAAIPGVTAPVAGKTPVAAITETDQYTGTVSWSPVDNPFEYETAYTATITLTPKTGYTFTGVSADFFTVNEATATNPADSGVVTAVFPETEPNAEYTVIYNGNNNTGGTVPVDPNEYAEGDTLTVLGNTGSLEKTGYNFDGWNTAADGTGTDYAPGETFVMGASDVTLYAKWTYSLTLIAGTGGSVNIEGGLVDDIAYGEYYEGTKVEIMATHDRGYQLILWEVYIGDSANIADTGSAITTVTMNEDMLMTANFEECTPEDFFDFDETSGTITGYDKSGGPDVVIPRMIDGVPVQHIGDQAFTYKNLTSITIPDSVTTIGTGAFKSNQLTSVTIPDSVTTIGASAFIYNQLTSVTIPDSVTTISGFVFCVNQLTSVTIPDSVNTIGEDAFYLNALTSVTIGANVNIDGSDSTMGTNTGFKDVYDDGGKLAGTYNYTDSAWVKQSS